MKLNINWLGLLKAVAKAVFPFFAGALGGLASGCSIPRHRRRRDILRNRIHLPCQ